MIGASNALNDEAKFRAQSDGVFEPHRARFLPWISIVVYKQGCEEKQVSRELTVLEHSSQSAYKVRTKD